jgi:hypothetical protein
MSIPAWARRIRTKLVANVVVSGLAALTATAYAADKAAETGQPTIVLAVVGLCSSMVGFMLFFARAHFAWLNRVEPQVTRKRNEVQPAAASNGSPEWPGLKLLQDQTTWIIGRMNTLEAHQARQDQHLDGRLDRQDERLDEMHRRQEIVQKQLDQILASQKESSQLLEKLVRSAGKDAR